MVALGTVALEAEKSHKGDFFGTDAGRSTVFARKSLPHKGSEAWRFDAAEGKKGARYFDSQLGRFLGRDPLGYVDGMSMYRGWFVPMAVDPSGKHIKIYTTPAFGFSVIQLCVVLIEFCDGTMITVEVSDNRNLAETDPGINGAIGAGSDSGGSGAGSGASTGDSTGSDIGGPIGGTGGGATGGTAGGSSGASTGGTAGATVGTGAPGRGGEGRREEAHQPGWEDPRGITQGPYSIYDNPTFYDMTERLLPGRSVLLRDRENCCDEYPSL
jgi:hypothetical protein